MAIQNLIWKGVGHSGCCLWPSATWFLIESSLLRQTNWCTVCTHLNWIWVATVFKWNGHVIQCSPTVWALKSAETADRQWTSKRLFSSHAVEIVWTLYTSWVSLYSKQTSKCRYVQLKWWIMRSKKGAHWNTSTIKGLISIFVARMWW